MFINLLAETNPMAEQWPLFVIIVIMIGLLVVFGVINSRKRKKQEKDAQDLINAVKPGNKVKTIGGICGIVVEVNEEENTFVLETGSEASGKSYVKFDRQAIYQTDAVVDVSKTSTTDAPSADTAEEAPAEDIKTEEIATEANEDTENKN